ncbi:uncharacterized protein BX663DRAFT_515472 [Cokeromyces recurvatus]|uniref:uncharacterized protein n=1 Tax=Cokeromyces recurvatus TaxID=90255 RepID=UPI00221F3CB1|nr:uncharacterized protein BX663DRAFT_515472 [Cokeromyces recurvatus]KAI7901272.1 hypothetical protein BX663DRAFT_515472 [Cokeromyces recurvatus]
MSGLYDFAAGNIKKAVGSAVGNSQMQNEGAAQCSHGKAQGDNCDTCRETRGTAQSAKDKASNAFGYGNNTNTEQNIPQDPMNQFSTGQTNTTSRYSTGRSNAGQSGL